MANVLHECTQARARQYDVPICSRYGTIARHMDVHRTRAPPVYLLNGHASAEPLCGCGTSALAAPERKKTRLCQTSLTSTTMHANHAPSTCQNIKEAGHDDGSNGRRMGAGSPTQALKGVHAASTSRCPVAPKWPPPQAVEAHMRELFLVSISKNSTTTRKSTTCPTQSEMTPSHAVEKYMFSVRKAWRRATGLASRCPALLVLNHSNISLLWLKVAKRNRWAPTRTAF